MINEICQSEDISRGRMNGGGEGVGSAICQRRANKGSINVKERERGKFI